MVMRENGTRVWGWGGLSGKHSGKASLGEVACCTDMWEWQGAADEKHGRKNIPERRSRELKGATPVTHGSKTKPALPLKPTNTNSKGITRIKAKGLRRERGLQQVERHQQNCGRWKAKTWTGTELQGRRAGILALFSLSCSMAKALMSLEKIRKPTAKRTKIWTKASQFMW